MKTLPRLLRHSADPNRLTLFVALCSTLAIAADWPQWRGENRDGVWSETGIMETFPAEGLKPKWRVKCGPGYSTPVVAQGRVFLMDSLPQRPRAKERVRCFDENTGKEQWTHAWDAAEWPDYALDEYIRSDDPRRRDRQESPGVSMNAGPVATPVVSGGKVYALGRSGHLCCLDATTGAVLWEKNLDAEYQLAKWCCTPSPLIEGGLLIVFIGGKKGADVVTFDVETGKEAWRALDEGVTNSSPLVIAHHGERQLIVWTKQSVTALAPKTGAVRWRERVLTHGDYAVSTPVYRDGMLLLGGLMLKLDAPDQTPMTLWPDSRSTSKRVLSNTSTALFDGTHVYSARSKGQFVCLDATTGKQVWEDDKLTALQNFPQSGAALHLIAQGGSVLIYNDQGELIRAKLTPQGCQELSRTRIAQPENPYGGIKLAWPPPAFANGHVFARTDEELVCVSLAEDTVHAK